MAKLLLGSWVVAAMLASTPTGARFEKDGVRVGDALVRGAALELKEVGAGMVLASGTVIEPLSEELAVAVDDNRTMVLEPGVRVVRADGAVRVSAHAGKRLRLEAEGRSFELGSEAALELVEAGWLLGAEEISAATVRVSLRGQDQGDPDRDLEAMRRAASRIQSRQTSNRVVRKRRVFTTDPTVGNEATDSKTLKTLTQVTPIGF